MSNATIRDVAREAAVSVASVSRVINGHDNVRPEMRKRVEAAVSKLAYAPHAGARNLSMARTHSIGVVLPDLHGEFFSELVRGMDREASAQGYQLLLSNIHSDPDHAVATLRNMRGRVDGLLVMAPHIEPKLLHRQLPRSMPVLLINCAAHHEKHGELRFANAEGSATMVDHLVSLGCRHIVHLAGPQDNVEGAARLQGYQDAMARHGLKPSVIEGKFDEESGGAAADRILARPNLPDALFAANDMMAIGALVALRRSGVSVPGDMLVAGFDDIPLARLITPPLTTISVDIAGLGARALGRLSAMIDGTADDNTESVVGRLVIRESTGNASDLATSFRSHAPEMRKRGTS